MKDPIAYLGRRRRSYFEGWYFKHVTATGEAIALIPGVSYDAAGGGHAFVQVIRGSDGATTYQKYPIAEFSAGSTPFHVQVGPNRFSLHGVEVDLPGSLGGMRGHVTYRGVRRPATTLFRPGIMGWYRYIPWMECYHEAGSVDHTLDGALTVGKREYDFAGGRGYLEKDWGTSMPSAWVWMQCNCFAGGGSLMLSIARVPWLGSSFTGFLGFIAAPDNGRESSRRGPVDMFGTWSGARVQDLRVVGSTVEVKIASSRWELTVSGHRSRSGSLAAPADGAMDRRISESIDGSMEVHWRDRTGGTLWADTGHAAGIEVVDRLPIQASG